MVDIDYDQFRISSHQGLEWCLLFHESDALLMLSLTLLIGLV